MKTWSWSALGRSWGGLGRSWVDLGWSWNDLGWSWGGLGRSWGDRGWSWGDLWGSWVVLERSWAVLGWSWTILVRSWGGLGWSWGALGDSWVAPGAPSGDQKSIQNLIRNRAESRQKKIALELRLSMFQSLITPSATQMQSLEKAIKTAIDMISSHLLTRPSSP